MKRPSSLRRRIIAASFALALLICALFSVALFGSLEYAESILFDRRVEADIETFIAQYNRNPGVADLPRRNFEVFVARHEDGSNLPGYLTDIDPGEDEVVRKGREYHLDTRRQGNTIFYFLFDETAFEEFDQLLNVFVPLMILSISIVAILAGVILANRIVRPVTALAARVDTLESRGGATAPGTPANSDEIEILAQAIDGFQARVHELLTREREFSSDVSHELRTPLMGIQAAAENLSVGTATRERIDELSGRIQARCAEMRALIEAMLTLARDPHSLENDFQDVPLADVLREQVEVAAPLIQSKSTEVCVIETADPLVFASPAVLNVLFGNLLQNAIVHSDSTRIHVELIEKGFAIKDFGRGIAEEFRDRIFDRHISSGDDPQRDFGIGLALVRRLCRHFDWDLALDSSAGSGTTIRINFGASLRSRD